MDDDWLTDLLIDDKIMITKSVLIPAVSGLYRPTGLLFSDHIDGNTQQSHVLIQPAAVLVVGTPSTGVAGCVWCFWSQVSLFSCYSRHPFGNLLWLDSYQDTYRIATSVSRYESYCETPVSLHPLCFIATMFFCRAHGCYLPWSNSYRSPRTLLSTTPTRRKRYTNQVWTIYIYTNNKRKYWWVSARKT